jgi:hypothetical protein
LEPHTSDSPPMLQFTGQAQVTDNPTKSTATFFTYRAQLTFFLSSAREVNVADFFLNWFKQSKLSPLNFSLLPFHSETGDQSLFPEDIIFSKTTMVATESFSMAILQEWCISKQQPPGLLSKNLKVHILPGYGRTECI